MKYFTKELWQLNTFLHHNLKPSGRASTFSEEYFQELYAQHVQERLDFMKRVSEVDIEALAERLRIPEAAPVRADGNPLTDAEKSEFTGLNTALADALRKAPKIQFNPEKERQFAHNQYLCNLRRVECSLPADILNRVADVRVLALKHATPEIIDAIREYCESNKQIVEAACNAYNAEFKRNFAAGKPGFLQSFQWHDAKVLSVRQENGDICLDFNWNCSCRFVGAEFVVCDESLVNAYWEDDEIYPLESGGYEIHALLYRPPEVEWTEGTLVEFIMRCRDVKILDRD